ncbi:hypothetical protein L7F22_006120 [Adiantum nelumboides]|nr:hypothetical protein [Adiantum nelumboides]
MDNHRVGEEEVGGEQALIVQGNEIVAGGRGGGAGNEQVGAVEEGRDAEGERQGGEGGEGQAEGHHLVVEEAQVGGREVGSADGHTGVGGGTSSSAQQKGRVYGEEEGAVKAGFCDLEQEEEVVENGKTRNACLRVAPRQRCQAGDWQRPPWKGRQLHRQEIR